MTIFNRGDRINVSFDLPNNSDTPSNRRFSKNAIVTGYDDYGIRYILDGDSAESSTHKSRIESDITKIDPDREWEIDPRMIVQQSAGTPVNLWDSGTYHGKEFILINMSDDRLTLWWK